MARKHKGNSPTLADIAAEVGMSVATVCRVMSGSDNVSPDKARAVEEVANKLGYVPRKHRPGSESRKRQGVHTGLIAFFSLENRSPAELYRRPVFPLLLGGVQQAAARHGLHLTFAHARNQESVPPLLALRQVDGVVLFGFDPLTPRLAEVLTDIPTVWCFRGNADTRHRFDHVFYNNAPVGELAADYLVERGHKQLAFVNPKSRHPMFIRRRERFIEAARRRGAEVTVFEPPPSTSTGPRDPITRSLTRQFLETHPRPTGVFCPGDTEMLSFFIHLKRNGIDPGRDPELIGCNNDPAYMVQMHPRPATVDIKLETVGKCAVEQLLRRMAHPDRHRTETLIQPEVVEAEKAGSQKSEDGDRWSEIGDQRSEVGGQRSENSVEQATEEVVLM